MAITAGLCYGAKQDFLNGVHQPSDTYKLAFYANSANLAPDTTTAYTAAGEVTNGSVIPVGGVTLGAQSAGNGTLATGYLDWPDVNVTVTGTFTARGAMLYNATRSNRAIGLFDFGSDKTATDGPFQVTIPGSGTGVVRFA